MPRTLVPTSELVDQPKQGNNWALVDNASGDVGQAGPELVYKGAGGRYRFFFIMGMREERHLLEVDLVFLKGSAIKDAAGDGGGGGGGEGKMMVPERPPAGGMMSALFS